MPFCTPDGVQSPWTRRRPTTQTYTMIAGDTLDLSELRAEERAYLEAAAAAFRADRPFARFMDETVHGPANPLLAGAGGWVTDAVWRHPLYRALRDLAARLGIAQGQLAPEGDWRADPFADVWLSPTDAARAKGVTRTALYKAIDRGDILARPADGSGRLRVSRNSMGRWTPNRTRQEAGRRAEERRRPATV